MTDNTVDTQTDDSAQFRSETDQADEEASVDNGDVTTPEPRPTEAEAPAAEQSEQVEEPAAAEVVEETAAPAAIEAAVVETSEPVTDATEVATAEASTETTEEEEEEDEDEDNYFFTPGDWYVVHTYAGYENKVRANLSSRIQSMNMEEKIYDVVVPTEEVMELKSGKMQSVQKKVFPGYILVRMELDDDSWYVVRNTPGVTGFVGSGAKPTPLDPTEVSKILAPKTEERPRPKLEYEVGEVVSVVGGAFAGYSGPVSAIEVDKQRVTVLLDLFGRETPVELTFEQVTKL